MPALPVSPADRACAEKSSFIPLRNWVVAPPSQGMTPCKSPQGEPTPFKKPVAGYGLVRVVRACRKVPAHPRPIRGHDTQIKLEQRQSQNLHRSPLAVLGVARRSPALLRSCSAAALRAQKSARWLARRAINTTFHPGPILARRTTSLNLRLILLRTTAFPILRPATTANLDLSLPLGRALSTNNRFDQVRPWL